MLLAGSSFVPVVEAAHRAGYDDLIADEAGLSAEDIEIVPNGEEECVGEDDPETPRKEDVCIDDRARLRFEGLRQTFEPDHESTDAFTPGTPIENCVVDIDGVGAEDLSDDNPDGCDESPLDVQYAGEGGTFLDNAAYAQCAPAGCVYNAPTNSMYRAITGDSSQFLVGQTNFMAWFGLWDDKNDDGRIDDVCKYRTDAPSRAADEFVWRGISSGENGGSWSAPEYHKLTMLAWVSPFNFSGDFTVSVAETKLPDFGERSDWRGPDFVMTDRTSEDAGVNGCPSNTMWTSGQGGGYLASDSILHETVMLTAVNPPVSTDEGGYSPADAAYRDVDRYSGLSPTISGWYMGFSDTAYGETGNASRSSKEILSCYSEATFEDPNYCAIVTACEIGASGNAICPPAACNAEVMANASCIEEHYCDVAGGPGTCPPPLPCDGPPVGAPCPTSVAGVAWEDSVRFATPVMPHEPNTPFDSYPGAAYGGTSFAAGTGCGTDTARDPAGSCNDYLLTEYVDHDGDSSTPPVGLDTGYGGGWHAWTDNWPYLVTEVFRKYLPLATVSGFPQGSGLPACNVLWTCFGNPYAQPPGEHGDYNDLVLGPGEYMFAQRSPAGDVAFGGLSNHEGTTGLWYDANMDTWIGNVSLVASNARGDGPLGSIEPSGNNAVGALTPVNPQTAPYGGGQITDPNDYRTTQDPADGGEWRICAVEQYVQGVLVPGNFMFGWTSLEPLTIDGSWGGAVILSRNFTDPWRDVGTGTPTGGLSVVTAGPISFSQGCERPRDTVTFMAGDFAPISVKATTTMVFTVDDPTTPQIETTMETVVDVDIFTRWGGA